MNREEAIKKLADIVEKNPTCNFVIDNDCWEIYAEKFNDELASSTKELASSSDFAWETEWYSTSNQYGIGLAEVLVYLLNQRDFSLTAGAV